LTRSVSQIAWLHAVFHRETFEAEHDRATHLVKVFRDELLRERSIWHVRPDRVERPPVVHLRSVSQIAWLHAVFHRETFEAEHDRAWEMIDSGRREVPFLRDDIRTSSKYFATSF
jgi:hypothetical protein